MKDIIYHNSHDIAYRNPFGAIETNRMLSIAVSVSKSIAAKEVFLNIIKQDKIDVLKMNQSGIENGYIYYKKDINTADDYIGLVFYYFSISYEKGMLFYGNNPEHLGGVGSIYKDNPKYYQITIYENIHPVPVWFKNSIVYQIFPDRFYNKKPWIKNPKKNSFVYGNWDDDPFYIKDKDGNVVKWDFFGGNIEGIIEKLHYLKELGISAIYLNPIFESSSNHRYDTGDYKKVDPILGDDTDFEKLCNIADKLGIKIILDGVFSHTGDDSIYFNRYGNYPEIGAYESKQSKYYKWYQFEEGTDKYKCWWGVEALPNVNEMEPSYIDYIISGKDSVIEHWMKKGAKGWRLDVADELPDDFIKLIKNKMKAIDSDSVLIGEVWEDASNKISYNNRREYFYGQELDSATNYPLRKIFIDLIKNNINGKETHRKIMCLYENYPKDNFYSCLNLIGSHDVPRILTIFEDHYKNPKLAIKALKLIIMLQMTFPGVPCIYYGDEAGVRGWADPDNRRTYPWGNENSEILSYYKKMIALRNNNDIFVHGDFQSLYIDDDVYAFIRSLNDKNVVVLVNPLNEMKNIFIPILNKNIQIEPMSGVIYRGGQSY